MTQARAGAPWGIALYGVLAEREPPTGFCKVNAIASNLRKSRGVSQERAP